MVLSAAMRGLFGFTGWQGREHWEPVSLTYITSIPLADEVRLYCIFCSAALQILQGALDFST